MILSLYNRRILRAVCLITPSPSVTCPSAAITTLPLRRTHNTVVERISFFLAIGGTDYIGRNSRKCRSLDLRQNQARARDDLRRDCYATAPFGFHAPMISP